MERSYLLVLAMPIGCFLDVATLQGLSAERIPIVMAIGKNIYIQSRRFEPPSAYRPSPFHHEAKLRAVERQLSDVKKQDSALRGSVWAHDSRNSLN